MKYKSKELDVYSGIAILFVVLIHANAFYLGNILKFETYADSGYFLGTIDEIIHVSVPMFIFIAGYKYQLGSKNINYKTYFKKRISKVLPPFLFVSLLFILFNNFNVYLFDIVPLIKNILLDLIKIFLGYNFAYQLWYVPMYLFIVLSYPLIFKYIQTKKTRMLLFITLSSIYVIIANHTNILGRYLNPFSFVYYFVFFEIGCYFADNKLDKVKKYFIYVSYLIALIISVITAGTALGTTISDLILTPLAVCAFYYISLHLKNNKVLEILGHYSFYIFLFHEPIIVKSLSKFLMEMNLYNGYYITLLITILAILISISLYKILKLIGLSRYIFNEVPQNTNIVKMSSNI